MDYTFPYDFTATAKWAVFLTSTTGGQHFTEWNPFAGGGIALPYNAVSGLYFPVWWIMGALHIPATLKALTIVQVVHVFLGGVGTFALARSLGLERRWALVASTAFLFFGGMYSNGSHDVILRGHSYAPWILWTLTPPKGDRGWVKVLFLPLWVWLLTSGGYSGQAMAFMQVAMVYLGTNLWMAKRRLREFAGYLIPALIGAAAVMVAVYYPAAAASQAGELYRPFEPTPLMRSLFALQPRDFWGLYLDPFAWGYAVATVTGWAVGAAVLIGLTGLTRAQLHRNMALVAAGITAFLLAFLPSWIPVGRIMSSIPLLFPSRLPASDSKAMVAVVLVCLASMGWRRFAGGGGSRVLPAVAGLLMLAGIPTAPRISEVEPVHYPSAVVLLILCAVALSYLGPRISSRVFLAAVMALTVAEGTRIAFGMEFAPGQSPWSLPAAQYPLHDLHDTQAQSLRRQLDDPPRRRPARVPETDPAFTLQGGTTADAAAHLGTFYGLGDYAGAMTAARKTIAEDSQLREVMLKQWTAWIWSCDQVDCTQEQMVTPQLSGHQSNQVRTLSYGLDRIRYRVSLQQQSLLIENEMYSRGWDADRSDVSPVSVDGILRGWVLPAGDYEFTAFYALPEREVQITLAGLALLAVAISIYAYRQAEKVRLGRDRHGRFG